MKWFYIGYELLEDKRDYSGLWDELEQLSARRALPSVWFARAKHSTNAVDLAESIGRHLGSDDRLLVVESCDSKWKNPVNNPLAQLSGATQTSFAEPRADF